MRFLPPVPGSRDLVTLPVLSSSGNSAIVAAASTASDQVQDANDKLDKLLEQFQIKALEQFQKFRIEDITSIPLGPSGRAVKLLGYAVAGGKTLVAIFRREGDNSFGEVFRINLEGVDAGDNAQARSLWDRIVAWVDGPSDPAGELVVLPMWSRDP